MKRSSPVKVMTVFGTRPEAIKMAPVVQSLLAHPEIETKVCLTAQHREMLDQVVDLFKLPVDYDLDIMRSGQSLYDITSRVLRGLEEVLEKEKPDYVLVHGDTTTTFTASLAAFYKQIKVGHVEAGCAREIWRPLFLKRRTASLRASWPVFILPRQKQRGEICSVKIKRMKIFLSWGIPSLMRSFRR